MRLTVGDIKFSESGYVSTNVKVEPGEYPCIPLSICTMHISVPMVEGKTLEQYKDEILGEARERISGMYKEIVCDGQDAESLCEDFMGKSGDEGIWSMGFRIEDREGRLVVCDENGESEPTREHRDKIIERAISMLRSGNRNMLKRLGR
ncbi:hypothetical protein ACV2IM_24270, partial [Salmonella enterica subsp. enterica serovar Morehead]